MALDQRSVSDSVAQQLSIFCYFSPEKKNAVRQLLSLQCTNSAFLWKWVVLLESIITLVRGC